ncbi:hypothetical protein [Staphylococcus warneri]|uniref:Phage protein n=1 Tax=Staphylococcus warneri TaxID=1292 RepID=A0AB36BIK7_STAWA|nr:hypothetical protein [Staphylococcus warneri]EAC3256959.1 hypothetical protein [Listeria monocytogenes]NBH31804.1 hypothetical protein [Staphylococcus warneri]
MTVQQTKQNQVETIEEQREKEQYIAIIDMCIGLTDNEAKELRCMELRKVAFKYKLVLTEKTDEMLG